MCVIVYKPKDVTIDRETLHDCYLSNPDGIGYMHYPNGDRRVRIHKGMDIESLITELDEIDGEAVIHFRLATHGEVDEANCHPYPVTHDESILGADDVTVRAAIAHNGIIRKWADQKDKWSDTARFVYRYLAHIPRNKRHKALKKHAKNDGQKFALMNAKGVRMYGDWEQVDDVWFSNTMWQWTQPLQPFRFTNSTVYGGAYLEHPDTEYIDEWSDAVDDNWFECDICGEWEQLPADIGDSVITQDSVLHCSVCSRDMQEPNHALSWSYVP